MQSIYDQVRRTNNVSAAAILSPPYGASLSSRTCQATACAVGCISSAALRPGA